MRAIHERPGRLVVCGLLLLAGMLTCGLLAGCVTKSKAQSVAREAYLAGQRDAIAQMSRQAQEAGDITLIGPVTHPVVKWTEGMTLAKAIVTAAYNSPVDPSKIMIRRGANEIEVDPTRLLA